MAEHYDLTRVQHWCKGQYRVQVVHGGAEYMCECGLFEHFGLPCSHILRAQLCFPLPCLHLDIWFLKLTIMVALAIPYVIVWISCRLWSAMECRKSQILWYCSDGQSQHGIFCQRTYHSTRKTTLLFWHKHIGIRHWCWKYLDSQRWGIAMCRVTP